MNYATTRKSSPMRTITDATALLMCVPAVKGSRLRDRAIFGILAGGLLYRLAGALEDLPITDANIPMILGNMGIMFYFGMRLLFQTPRE